MQGRPRGGGTERGVRREGWKGWWGEGVGSGEVNVSSDGEERGVFDLTNTDTKTLELGSVAASQPADAGVIVLYLQQTAEGLFQLPCCSHLPGEIHKKKKQTEKKTTLAFIKKTNYYEQNNVNNAWEVSRLFTGKWAAAPEVFIAPNSPRDFSTCHDIDCATEESLPTVLVLMSPKANWKWDIVPWRREMLSELPRSS